jgi:VWFA-related protein
MKGRLWSVAVLLTVGAIGADPAAHAQLPVFRAGTDLIQIDVMVAGKDGRPVVGLTKGDFEILDRGKRLPIEVLAEFHGDRPAASALGDIRHDVVSNETVRTDRIVVMVLDDLHIRWDSTATAQTAARRLVAGLGGRVQMAVVFTSGKPGVEFTADPETLVNAIASIAGKENPFVGRGSTTWPGSPGRIDPSNPPGGSIGNFGLISGVQAREGLDRLWTTMEGALQKLPKHDARRKALILISEGAVLPRALTVGGAAHATTVGDASQPVWPEEALYTTRYFAFTDATSGGNRRLGEFINTVRKSDVTIYAIDARGKAMMGQEGYTGLTGSLNETDVAIQRQTSLRLYTDETGGFPVVDTNDIAGGVDRIVDDLDNYYMLGFAPADPKDTKMHTIDVRVLRAGLTVRTRHMYQVDSSPPTGPRPKDPLAALATSPVPIGDLPLRLWSTLLGPARAGAAPRTLLWIDSPSGPINEYAIYTFDMIRKREVDPPVARTMKGSVPQTFSLGSLALPLGRYQVRVTARSGGRGGSAYLTVQIPDFRTTPLQVTGLVIGDARDARDDIAPLPFAPTFTRTFDATATVRLAFVVWQLRPVDATATVVILNASNEIVQRHSVPVSRSPAPHGDLQLPFEGLAAGPYALRVTVASGSDSSSTDLAFWIKR